ncbi:MAG: DNA polymerase I [Spirochaetes bacterium GWB1_36_13]|nr:MAG: DNA polymerase I [Spirochaetes bacterium GWB1_36_13]
MMKKILLVDSFGLIFRSYYALIKQPLSTKKGFPTSAVMGFWRMYFRALKEIQPDLTAAVFDSPDNFRKEIYPEYKANRQEAPDDLKIQIQAIVDMVKETGFPSAMLERTEADDVIGYLADYFSEKDYEVYILSSDKDLSQLVKGKVRLVSPEKGVQELKLLDRDGVYEKFEVYPEQIADYLSLVGDASDNIPGAKGIGPKTAVKLLKDYQNIQKIYEQIDGISPESVKKKLIESRELVFLSFRLTQLKKDLSLTFSSDKDYQISFESAQKLYEKLKEFEVFSLLKDPFFNKYKPETGEADSLFSQKEEEENLFSPENIQPDTKESFQADKVKYRLVLKKEELVDLKKQIEQSKKMVFDTETTSKEPFQADLIGISISLQPKEAFYIPLYQNSSADFTREDFFTLMRSVFESPEIKKIGQNMKYDFQVMLPFVRCRGLYFDTMIAAYLLDPDAKKYNMDYLALQFLNYKTIHYQDIVAPEKTLLDVSLETVKDYSCEDADITYRLYEVFEPKLVEAGVMPLFQSVEMPMVEILALMEKEGVGLDTHELSKIRVELEDKLAKTEESIYQMTGLTFNINSPKQIAQVLFEKMGIPPVKKNKTGYSTNEAVLETLQNDYPVARELLNFRKYSKLLNTYINTLPDHLFHGRIHTCLHQTGTATGRLSSSDPNLQNIPIKEEVGKRIREAFVPAPGSLLVSADYSQVELRIMAHFSEDSNMKKAFFDGIDIHRRTASLIFDIPEEKVGDHERRIAKSINFGIIYGMGAFKLSQETGLGFRDAKIFIDKYFEVFEGVKSYIERLKENASRNGFVETLLGHKRYLQFINSKNKNLREADERMAVNTVIQGTNADIMKKMMIEIAPFIKDFDAKMILQIHDELLFEIKEEKLEIFESFLKEKMEGAVLLQVPLKVSIHSGKNWGVLK